MRILLHALAAFVGVAVSLAGMLVYRAEAFRLPLGLVLVLAATGVTAWALAEIQVRLVTSYVLGWLVAFGLVATGRPEGDYAIVADPRGYLMVAAAFVLLVVGVVCLAPHRGRPVGGAT